MSQENWTVPPQVMEYYRLKPPRLTVEPTRFLELCDLAHCAPDFSVVHHLNDEAAVRWLHDRLARYGHAVSTTEITDAMKAWDDRPRGKEHPIATIQL